MKHRIKRRRLQQQTHWSDPGTDKDELTMATSRPAKFRLLSSSCAIERAGALFALRMIEGERLHSRMVYRGDIRDHDLLALVGLELQENPDDALTPGALCDVLHEQRRRLESRSLPCFTALTKNIAGLARALGLRKVEQDVLRLAVVISQVTRFSELFNLGPFTMQHFCRMIRHAAGHTPARLQKALAQSGTLRRTGLLDDVVCFNAGLHPLDMDNEMATLLSSPDFDEQTMLRHMLRSPPPATLTLDDFPDSLDVQMLRRYIQSSVRTRRRGANVLIHGVPGTGKTEFVRALAESCGFQLSEVPVEDKEGHAISGQRRFRAFGLAQNLLSSRRKQILLFDEVEDVFGRGTDGFELRFLSDARNSPDNLTKGWINETLESNPVPTVWVCNRIEAFDPAYLRRFDLAVEFRTPSQSVRRRVVERHFPNDILSPQAMARLSTLEDMPPALIERAARVVVALNSPSQSARDREAERAASLSMRAMGIGKSHAASALPAHYDPAFLNTDRDLAVLSHGLEAGRTARLCLYGPPGTGKTAFGHHLAALLDRPLHSKRASDLISMWVGETEKNLANAFQAASDEDAILLIDEADSFLQDRKAAQRSWEISQVNEMLTQMESFNGIFIASTNLVESLDAASLRRFDFKIRFDYLNREQRRSLFLRVVQAHSETLIDEYSISARNWQQLDRMDQLVPGDVANALRQLKATDETLTPERLLSLLDAELRLKPGSSTRRIGF